MINTIMKKLTTKDFIKKSKEKHGDYYDYSKSVYIGAKKQITIICPKHGEFQQLAANHMHKSGCLKCSEERKVTTIEHFVDVCSKKHNNKYGYEKVIISNLNNYVKINCPEHGYFLQRPTGHMAGHGCKKCAGMEKLTTEEFIKKSNKKHDFKYTYDNVEFYNPKTTVSITCPVHGDFLQVPSDHLQGCGCQICAGTKKITTEEFIVRATKTHGNKYSYKNTIIDRMDKKLIITCQIHGDFSQRAADHLNGVGCPDCANGQREQYSLEYFNNYPEKASAPGILYLVKIKKEWCKVGITKKETVNKRFRFSKEINIISEYTTTLKNAYEIEQQILNRFSKFRYTANELRTLNFHGWTECFPISLLPKLIKEVDEKVAHNG